MSARTRPQSAIFRSIKTVSPIPIGHAHVRDALVMATLDPSVRSIELVAAAHDTPTSIARDVIVIRRDGADDDVEISAEAAETSAETVGPSDDLRGVHWREPFASNARAVWAYHARAVSLPRRLAILTTLESEGPMPLGNLLECLRCDGDPAPDVMALACQGFVELDLATSVLGPATTIRSRS